MKKNIAIALLAILAAGCSSNIPEVKHGEMRHIPWTDNLAVGTDSAIVIVNRKTFEVLMTIPR